MEHTCENCNLVFPIERHEAVIHENKRLLVTNTGKNMVYRGDMNREYAQCPGCGVVEHQFSAEARDQEED